MSSDIPEITPGYLEGMRIAMSDLTSEDFEGYAKAWKERETKLLCPWCHGEDYIGAPICPRCLGDGMRGEDCPECDGVGGKYLSESMAVDDWQECTAGCRCGRVPEEEEDGNRR